MANTNAWAAPWTDGPAASRRARPRVDAERIARDGLTPVDISGGATTAETERRRQEQAAASKQYVLSRALDGRVPNDAAQLLASKRANADGPSLIELYARWREQTAAKGAAEAEALGASRRKIAKRLRQGHPPTRAMSDGYGKYRRLGGHLSLEDWARRAS